MSFKSTLKRALVVDAALPSDIVQCKCAFRSDSSFANTHDSVPYAQCMAERAGEIKWERERDQIREESVFQPPHFMWVYINAMVARNLYVLLPLFVSCLVYVFGEWYSKKRSLLSSHRCLSLSLFLCHTHILRFPFALHEFVCSVRHTNRFDCLTDWCWFSVLIRNFNELTCHSVVLVRDADPHRHTWRERVRAGARTRESLHRYTAYLSLCNTSAVARVYFQTIYSIMCVPISKPNCSKIHFACRPRTLMYTKFVKPTIPRNTLFSLVQKFLFVLRRTNQFFSIV